MVNFNKIPKQDHENEVSVQRFKKTYTTQSSKRLQAHEKIDYKMFKFVEESDSDSSNENFNLDEIDNWNSSRIGRIILKSKEKKWNLEI